MAGDDGTDQLPDLDVDHDDPLAVAAAILEAHGYLSWLGVTVEELDHGRAVMALPYQEKLTNWVSGSIHGGVTATLVDTASAFALRSQFDDPFDVALATTDLNVKYVRPATSDLTVEADAIRRGGNVGVTRVDVRGTAPDGTEKTVAIGATTYRLFSEESDG
ncbi:MAG: PaaI family thioesterase [Haloarculaceae archaeon]